MKDITDTVNDVCMMLLVTSTCPSLSVLCLVVGTNKGDGLWRREKPWNDVYHMYYSDLLYQMILC